MTTISEIANILTEKDDAITDMIYWLRQHQENCDANHPDSSVNCDVGHHYFLCKSEIQPILEKLIAAARLR